MKKLTKNDWITFAVTTGLTMLPMAFGLAVYHKLPAQMPVHWNAAGEVDGYGSRTLVVFVIPAFMVLVNVICQLATLSDPKRANTDGKIRTLVFWLLPVISIVTNTVVLLAGLGREVKIEVITPLLVGIVFILIGNYMPKAKQNYTIGIKLPWTLHSEENWRRTHRLGGWIFMLGGVMMLVAGFVGSPLFMTLMLVALIAMVLVPVIYSYILYRKGI